MPYAMRTLVAFVSMMIIAGCGGGDGKTPTLAAVKGSVTYNGSPLAGATVTFIPEKGPLAIGTTNLSGEFKLNTGALPGCAVGLSKVSVRLDPPSDEATASSIPKPGSGGDITEQSKQMAQMTMAAQQSNSKIKSLIPDKYRDANRSGLEYKVDSSGSKNDFKIELKD